MTFAEKLKKLRNEKGLSQREVAAAVGISQVAICHYENGDDVPAFRIIKDLAKLFEVSLSYFDD